MYILYENRQWRIFGGSFLLYNSTYSKGVLGYFRTLVCDFWMDFPTFKFNGFYNLLEFILFYKISERLSIFSLASGPSNLKSTAEDR